MSTATTVIGALDPDVSQLAPTLSTIRRSIPEYPEMGFQEVRPAARPIGAQVLARATERFLA